MSEKKTPRVCNEIFTDAKDKRKRAEKKTELHIKSDIWIKLKTETWHTRKTITNQGNSI